MVGSDMVDVSSKLGDQILEHGIKVVHFVRSQYLASTVIVLDEHFCLVLSVPHEVPLPKYGCQDEFLICLFGSNIFLNIRMKLIKQSMNFSLERETWCMVGKESLFVSVGMMDRISHFPSFLS